MRNLPAVERSARNLEKRVPRLSRWLRKGGDITAFVLDTFVFSFFSLGLRFFHRILDKVQDRGLPDLSGPLGPALPATREWLVDTESFDQLVDFGMRAFPGSGLTREERAEMYARWLSINPNTFRFITLTETKDGQTAHIRRVGYTCVLPLKEASYDRYYRGALSEYNFGEEDIVRGTFPFPSTFLCLQAFAIDDQEVTRSHWIALYQSLARHIFVLLRRFPRALPKIIAEGETRSGRHILTRRGFTQIGPSANEFPLFEVDLSLPFTKLRPSAETLKREIQRLFSELSRQNSTYLESPLYLLPGERQGEAA